MLGTIQWECDSWMLAPLSKLFMYIQLFLNVKCIMLGQLRHLIKSPNTSLCLISRYKLDLAVLSLPIGSSRRIVSLNI